MVEEVSNRSGLCAARHGLVSGDERQLIAHHGTDRFLG
jgi:hypothetical protein